MIDKDRIAVEAICFFEWPDPNRKDHVTLTSCVLFATTIAEMVRKEERERHAKLRTVSAHVQADSRIAQLEAALKLALEQMEGDWMQIDQEWGPSGMTLDEECACGDAPVIAAVRALVLPNG